MKSCVILSRRHIFPLIVFFIVSLYLTFKNILSGSLVIGDNFFWSLPTVQDILGPQVLHESYLGDVAVLSSFKNGFLFPFASFLNLINSPITLIYPFLFFFLSMLSFYSLSAEFLKNKNIRIIVSLLYLINPVVPFYFGSLLLAFALIFLPLAFKFFIRTLCEIDNGSISQISLQFLICATFLGIAISAHEQLVFSVLLVTFTFLITFVVFLFRKYGFTKRSLKNGLSNVLLFISSIFLINLPLLLSLGTLASSPFSSYYTERLNDFITTVNYTYQNARIDTLLRFGGDAGLGLGQNAWFDSGSISNIFGYVIFALVVGSLILIVRQKLTLRGDRAFFIMTFLLFLLAISLILFIKYLPSNRPLLDSLFGLSLQSWQSPTKLRALMLLSGLTLSLIVFQKLEKLACSNRKKIVTGVILFTILTSTIAYNAPWVINYYGNAPFQQISDNLNWGSLSDEKYMEIVDFLEKNITDDRGLIIPYTHKAELYSPPNFRVLQLVSEVNNKLFLLTQASNIPWSKVLGLLSAKYIAINDGDYNPHEILIFPKVYDQNLTRIRQEITADSDFNLSFEQEDFSVYTNSNSLPKTYASNYYVIYDQMSSLPYAMRLVNFSDLPVFISSEPTINKFVYPHYMSSADYNVYAASIENSNEGSTLKLEKNTGDKVESMTLEKNSDLKDLDLYSTTSNLRPGDSINFPSDIWIDSQYEESLILNSTSHLLGTYGSFMLNFTVNMVQNGEFSFLCPRVLIDLDNSTRYFILFHDNGVIELAMMQDNIFHSGLLFKTADYDLKTPLNTIDVTVRREFELVEVFVNGELSLSFPINTIGASVSLSSEKSVSTFSDINVKVGNVVRIFATKCSADRLDFLVLQDGPNRSILRVYNENVDYAVVSQYLNTPLRNIIAPLNKSAITANIFFNGWIIQQTDGANEIKFEIGIQNWELTIALTFLSILFTYSVLFFSYSSVLRKKIVQKISTIFLRVKSSWVEK